MKKLFVLIPLFATVWQVKALAVDWGSRVANEQEWLIDSLTPPVEKMAEETAFVEDSISTGQAAVQKEEIKKVEESLVNPWDIRGSNAPKFQPTRKRSR